MNQALKVLENAKNCTLLDNLKIPGVEFCIKDRFFNAVLGRIEQKHEQKDVAKLLKISKRTVVDLEKGNVDKITLIFRYIQAYSFDFAENKKELKQIAFKNTITKTKP